MPGRLQLLGVRLGTRGASAVPAAGCRAELRVSSLVFGDCRQVSVQSPDLGWMSMCTPPAAAPFGEGCLARAFGISPLSLRWHRFRPPRRPWQPPALGMSVAAMPSLRGVEFAPCRRPGGGGG